ncbi:MAG: DNA-directed RNA polymerase subunit alpha [Candidatus Buchananbacteria bacterium RIFCSPHIGHO2_02_FULL_56_16]|uniref:DNA-directed RNA polymerase subunit alpha n=1 Tax=Candidatus Buchananbacteria bacterium RIFCSPHIGHO2_02_FULL_56_16 TaxID=1797542 RepID=A0A1G1YFF0_9BACT|nr:MAG: DNA-directed RNA polymerase subunit alpha [Candidatus Buchananbacteria bacterium RIFCSPHIGHO2_02_FULL_56_16]
MEPLALPSKIEIQKGRNENEAIISIQPCHPGYGTTLGNALRRVILSSLPGAAVTAFKIKGVSHEFSAVPHVLEDVVQIALNLKQLRLKVHSAEPVRIELEAKGEKKVTSKDIKPSADVEVVNPEMVIATLTDKNAELKMELIVSQGRGYVPTEVQEKENLEVGMIPIDAIFTPARNVGFRVENVRVGQMTNFENLILTIETDGNITPQEALTQATQILLDHFNFIVEANKVEDEPIKPKRTRKAKATTTGETAVGEAESETQKEAKPKRASRTKKAAKAEAVAEEAPEVPAQSEPEKPAETNDESQAAA